MRRKKHSPKQTTPTVAINHRFTFFAAKLPISSDENFAEAG